MITLYREKNPFKRGLNNFFNACSQTGFGQWVAAQLSVWREDRYLPLAQMADVQLPIYRFRFWPIYPVVAWVSYNIFIVICVMLAAIAGRSVSFTAIESPLLSPARWLLQLIS